MKRHLGSTVSVGAAAVAVLLVGSSPRAQGGANVISTQFVTVPSSSCCQDYCGNFCCGTCPWTSPLCCYGGTRPLGPDQLAGVVDPAGSWNTAMGNTGSRLPLTNGAGGDSGATIEWEATQNTDSPITDSTIMRNPVNFKFTDSDAQLMSGYLDQVDKSHPSTRIVISGIPFPSYDVVVYTLTTMPNLGGVYEVSTASGSQQTKFVLAGGNGVYNGPKFFEAFGDDPNFGERDWGNYVVFRGLSGKTVTITATNEPGIAPVNGVQIVGPPP